MLLLIVFLSIALIAVLIYCRMATWVVKKWLINMTCSLAVKPPTLAKLSNIRNC